MNTPAHTPLPNSSDMDQVVEKAITLARRWLDATGTGESKQEAKSTEQLAALVHDARGIDFTMSFVDRVARPEDNTVAARELARLASPFAGKSLIPDFVGTVDKSLVTLGSIAAPLLPGVVMPIARKRLRQLVGHLVLDADGKALNELLDRSAEQGFRLNLNLLGEAVLGEKEATKRLNSTIKLLQNPRVTYVSIKASSVCAQLNPWDIDGNIERLKNRLRPLYRAAVARSPHPFINMDMEEYKDLNLTIRLFKELLSEDEFLGLEAGIVLQAYLPDTFAALQELTEFAHERTAKGGAPIKIRLVKGANLSMERVEAEVHDWEQAPYLTKAEVDANYFRLMDWVLQPEHADHVRIGVASHNLYTVAMAHELSVARGVQRQLDIEMLQGMAPSQARAVRDVVGDLILYTPVVKDEDFDVAVSYLVRRLEENGEKENFLYALFAPEVTGPDGLTPLQEQKQRFLDAVNQRWETFAGPRRTQNRSEEAANEVGCLSEARPGHFVGEPDTDPSLQVNRDWALQVLAADPGPRKSAQVTDVAAIDKAVATAHEASQAWAELSGEERAALLDRAADALANSRGELITVMTHEAGKTVGEADPEVSEAIDFARYYGQCARDLDRVQGATFTPHKVVLVTPPWNFPVAIPLGGVFAALAAGAAVIIKPAPQVLRCAEVAIDILHEAGIPREVLQLVNADEADAGKHLVSHPQVDHVILTGASETAKLFRSWDPTKPLSAETSGKNAIIVTPSADPDLAVADVYKSAFGHAGQKCSAASLVILVGSVGSSQRFLGQLVDAVETLKVGPGTDISTTMNGIIEPPSEKLLRGLTQLEPGESWLVKPEKLNAEGTLWSPGLRDGVKEGSWYHTHECFGPVLGIMRADTLDDAIRMQNTTGFGLTGGLHSLDEGEIAHWRENVEVGNAYINRGITGAIVERQSFGGWKDSAVGEGAKAGGPNYVAHLGTWADDDVDALPRGSVSRNVAVMLKEFGRLFRDELTADDLAWLRAAAESDAHAIAVEFGVEHDKTGLVVESNVFRYKNLLEPLVIRLGHNYEVKDVLRQLLAAEATGTKIVLTAGNASLLEPLGPIADLVEIVADDVLARRIRRNSGMRVRAIGEVAPVLYEAAAESGSVIIDRTPVASGRRELLPYYLEQAVSMTRHRFGYIKQAAD
ncbi:proline dehydrogenase family protein [Corynebacterium choanae]|nr:proline dehydrogenase family protein [Corynebacterium choanae]